MEVRRLAFFSFSANAARLHSAIIQTAAIQGIRVAGAETGVAAGAMAETPGPAGAQPPAGYGKGEGKQRKELARQLQSASRSARASGKRQT